MSLDLKVQRDSFVKMNFEEKRNTVVALLEGVKEGNQLFTDLYMLITSDIAIEQDFYDIFDSLMIVLYREQKEEESAAMARLGEIRNNLELQRQKEAAEKLQWQKEAEALLGELL